MNRRAFLATGTAVLAGCLGDDETTLGPPSQPRGSPSHPVHGDPFPAFSVPDPFADESVTRDDLLAHGPFVMTFIYTSCTDRCGELMRLLELIQGDAAAEGWLDQLTLAAVTFDPATDEPPVLREYAETHGLDVDASHVRMLRPPDQSAALELVDDHFGVPAAHADHDHGPGHYYMVFLVNAAGITERAYPGPILFDRTPDEIVSAVRTVVD